MGDRFGGGGGGTRGTMLHSIRALGTSPLSINTLISSRDHRPLSDTMAIITT
jgi:hypothetical protein